MAHLPPKIRNLTRVFSVRQPKRPVVEDQAANTYETNSACVVSSYSTCFIRTSGSGEPILVFGFIPIGLFYQGCFSVAAALLMWLLVKFAWPSHLEHEVEETKTREDTAH